MIRKFLALTIVAVMLTGLIGCTSDKNVEKSTVITPTVSTKTQESTKPAEKPVIKISTFLRQDPLTLGSDFNTSGFYKLIMDKFKIDLSDVTPIPNSAFIEKYNVMIMSGDLKDIMNSQSTNNEINQHGMSGLLYPVNKLLDKMPNLKKLYTNYPFEKEYFTASDGNIYTLPSGYEEPNFYEGIVVRKDMLDKVGFDINKVETLDDIYQMMLKLKEANDGKAVMAPQKGFSWLMRFLYFTGKSPAIVSFDEKQKKFISTYSDPETLDIITFLRKCFDAGLLHKDSLTMSQETWNANAANLSWPIIAFSTVQTVKDYEIASKAEGKNTQANYVTIKPVKYKGELRQWPTRHFLNREFVVNAKTKNADRIAEMFDWLYSREGYTSVVYGVKGESYDIVDGVAKWLFEDPKYPERFPASTKLKPAADLEKWKNSWKGWNNIALLEPIYMLGRMQNQKSGDKSWFMEDFVPKYKPVYQNGPWPVPQFTTEESEQIKNLGNALNTVCNETMSQMVFGMKPLTEWDAMLKKMKDVGIDKYMEIYNNAYNRIKK